MYGNQFRKVDTLRADNEFRFACPIFSSEVKIADCFTLFEQHKRGKRFAGREGCQACMASSKCPIYTIEREILHKDVDPYFSKEPKVGPLQKHHVEAISRVVVQEYFVSMFGVPDDQKEVMREAHARLIEGKLNSKDRGASIMLGSVPTQPKATRRAAKPASTEIATVKPKDTTVDAAISGDMSAAITSAAKETTHAATAERHSPELHDRGADILGSASVPTDRPDRPLTLAEKARLKREGRL